MRVPPAGFVGIGILLSIFILFLWFGGRDSADSVSIGNYQSNSAADQSVCTTAEEFVQLRLKEAEAIWARGVAAREEAVKKSALADANPYGIKDYRVFWDYFYPDYNCPHNVERLGRVGDGGKWVCGIPQLIRRGKDCIVYSYGIANDPSFEEDLLKRTDCSVHLYDHTIDTTKIKLPNDYPARATMSKLGLGVKNTEQLKTLKSEMDARGHTFIDVLKIDIERAEFAALDQILSDFNNELPCGQLLIEFHLGGLPQKNSFQKF